MTAREILDQYSDDTTLRYTGDCFGTDELILTVAEFRAQLIDLDYIDSPIPNNPFEELT